jgi:hypothetical protein
MRSYAEIEVAACFEIGCDLKSGGEPPHST